MPIASVVVLSWALMMCCAACAAGLRCGRCWVRRGERAGSAGRRTAGGAGSGRAGGSWPGP
eukprot:6325712-Prymnesium_polylepis.1